MMLAASFETFLVFLLIAGGSAFFNWLKKRGEKADDWTQIETPTTPRQRSNPVPPPARPTTNWEEELRRMLEGTAPTTQAPAPPPIVIQERKLPPAPPRQPAPPLPEPRPTMAVPKVFTEPKFYKAHCNYCEGHIEFPATAMDEVVSCPHCQRPTVLRPFGNTRVEVLAHKNVLANFAVSDQKYEEASQLSQRVAAHMHGIGHQAVGLTSIETRKKVPPEVAQTVALFQNAKSVRQAIIASLILAPPKALEN